MVSTRSGKRTSMKTKSFEQLIAGELADPTMSPRAGNLAQPRRNVYDIPSHSSEDSNYVLPSKLDRLNLTEEQSSSRLAHGLDLLQNEGIKERPHRKRPRDGYSAVLERTGATEPVSSPKPPKSPRFRHEKISSSKTKQVMSADRVTARDQHFMQRSIVSAPTTPFAIESSTGRGASTANDKVTKQKQFTKQESKSNSAISNFSISESSSTDDSTMSFDGAMKRSQQSKRKNAPVSVPTTPTISLRSSTKETMSASGQVKRKLPFLQRKPSASAPATPSSSTKRSPHRPLVSSDLQRDKDVENPLEAMEAEKTKLRSVHFCEESRNEVHIIPAVKTTIPFAEQMAKELEAEAQLAAALQSEENSPDQEQLNENIVPKCGRIMIGQRFIAVDFFVHKHECKYHFLTHAHFDHTVNLSKSWKYPIYCSELTAKLLPLVMGARAPSYKILRPLKVGKTHVIEPNLSVTLLEAHHCLGSVMYLFEGASVPGGSVLCTGDFRADKELLAMFDTDASFQKLAETSISKIYLDNTYLDHKERSFPERSESEKILLTEMGKLRDRPVLIPIFRLGREEILEKLSEALSEPIATGSQRLAVRRASGLEGGTFLDESSHTRIRTCPRQAKSVFAALKRMSPSTVVVDLSIRGEYQDVLKENLVSVPYSDHSSRDEIFAFLSRLRFGEVVPTSAPMQLTTAEELMKMSREMAPIPATTCATTIDIQKSVEARPAELGETEAVTPPATGLRFSAVSLQPADLSVFQLPCGINLLDFCPDTDPKKFRLDPPPGPKPIKVKFHDADGRILK